MFVKKRDFENLINELKEFRRYFKEVKTVKYRVTLGVGKPSLERYGFCIQDSNLKIYTFNTAAEADKFLHDQLRLKKKTMKDVYTHEVEEIKFKTLKIREVEQGQK